MDTDKTSTQLFFCFTSSSSSSMKIPSSRSVLSPARTGYSREPPPPITLSTSLSRRLSKSRSIRGGAASPAMFPVTGKKRGSGFDNPEPSSPKVTCIGQVRVKTRKKHGKNVRSLSTQRKLKHSRSQRQRNSSINSTSTAINNNGNNQRWVHIPMTICEALRTFGSEVSCLFPCRSSNEEKKVGSTRWVVALQDGEVEMVAGDDDGGVEVRSVRRHHVFDDLEIVNDVIQGSELEGVGDVIPPKNALLLMRGRSDPLKMEALTNQYLEPEEKHEEEFEDKLMEENKIIEDVEVEDEKMMVMDDINDTEDINLELEMNQGGEEEEKQEMMEKQEEEEEDQEQSMEINEEEESFFIGNLFEENADEDQELEEDEEESDSDMKDALEVLFEDEDVEETETGESNTEQIKQFEEKIETEELIMEEGKDEMLTEFTEKSEAGVSNMEEIKHFEEGNEEVFTQFTESCETEESKLEVVKHFEEEIEGMLTEFIARSETGESKSEEVKHFEEENEEILTEFTQISEILERENEEREKIESLPECLLLMMYEPKLSMEVSKETWVCSNDFIRSRSGRKKPPPQPPVESIDESKVVGQTSGSIPASGSMIAMLERKLVNTMGFEPLVLTRCKSEPMRRARETCCFQNQLEPPRRASFGVGMAGLAG
ncbi:uncharacterized protein LOC143620121 [Bidens hawaiensis]|uniref:uncharacterized protein LOC143620121 n=1 Tax=Bidens hawaiensis TaxID=980011 RepID=UPI004049C9C1